MILKNRTDAGVKLAEALEKYKGRDVVVFALPRGGVVLGAEIAKAFDAPLDLVIAKKVGHPFNPEYAVCAVGEKGAPFCNEQELSRLDPVWFQQELKRVRGEIKRRRVEYLGDSQSVDVTDKTAILVDDGIATGLTMMAAISELRSRNAKKIVVAIPVTPYETAQTLLSMADDLVSLEIAKSYLGSVGAYYMDFRQVEDEEVISLLKQANARHGSK